MAFERFTKGELYKAQFGGENARLIDYAGKVIAVKKFAITTDTVNQYEPPREVLHLIDTEGVMISAMSQTAISDFKKLHGIFGNDLKDIEVSSGVTKRGDEFITLLAGPETLAAVGL